MKKLIELKLFNGTGGEVMGCIDLKVFLKAENDISSEHYIAKDNRLNKILNFVNSDNNRFPKGYLNKNYGIDKAKIKLVELNDATVNRYEKENCIIKEDDLLNY